MPGPPPPPAPEPPEPLHPHINLLEALFYIDFEAQQRWVAGLDDASKINLMCVSRRVRARVEPHLCHARLGVTLRPAFPSDWLRSLDNFFAAVARRPRCDKVVMSMGLPSTSDAASKLALAFECAADSGCLSQVRRLELRIEAFDPDEEDGRPVVQVPNWGRKQSPKAAVGLAVALGSLFPRLRTLSLSGNWVVRRLLLEDGVGRMYAAWATRGPSNAAVALRDGRGVLSELHALEVSLELHLIQDMALPQLRRLVLLEARDGFMPEPQISYRAMVRQVTSRAGMDRLAELAFRSLHQDLRMPMLLFPPDLHVVLLQPQPQAGAAPQQGAAAGPAPAPAEAAPPPGGSGDASAPLSLRRLEMQSYMSMLPLRDGIGARLEDAEDRGARSFNIRSLIFDRITHTYSLCSSRLTAMHICEWMRLCSRPPFLPAGALAQPPLRLALDITTSTIAPPCGPLGASTAVATWEEIQTLAAADRRHAVRISAEAHAPGLLSAIRMVSVMATGVLRLAGTLVVHWDGWQEDWSSWAPPEGEAADEGGAAGGGAGVGGGGGLPSLDPTPARVEELADKLTALPAERRPVAVRLCFSRRRHGGSKKLPAGGAVLQQVLGAAYEVKIQWN